MVAGAGVVVEVASEGGTLSHTFEDSHYYIKVQFIKLLSVMAKYNRKPPHKYF